MRHFRSILYALVLAPAVWVLAGVGFTHDLTARGIDDFAVESVAGLLLLVLAGAAYAILLFAPISPAGPLFGGLAYLGISAWALASPDAYANAWPESVAKDGFDISRPGFGLAALLALPLICTALSARRWARYEPPVLPLIGQLGRARGHVAMPPHARLTDADPTTVIRLPGSDDTTAVVAGGGPAAARVETALSTAIKPETALGTAVRPAADDEKTAENAPAVTSEEKTAESAALPADDSDDSDEKTALFTATSAADDSDEKTVTLAAEDGKSAESAPIAAGATNNGPADRTDGSDEQSGPSDGDVPASGERGAADQGVLEAVADLAAQEPFKIGEVVDVAPEDEATIALLTVREERQTAVVVSWDEAATVAALSNGQASTKYATVAPPPVEPEIKKLEPAGTEPAAVTAVELPEPAPVEQGVVSDGATTEAVDPEPDTTAIRPIDADDHVQPSPTSDDATADLGTEKLSVVNDPDITATPATSIAADTPPTDRVPTADLATTQPSSADGPATQANPAATDGPRADQNHAGERSGTTDDADSVAAADGIEPADEDATADLATTQLENDNNADETAAQADTVAADSPPESADREPTADLGSEQPATADSEGVTQPAEQDATADLASAPSEALGDGQTAASESTTTDDNDTAAAAVEDDEFAGLFVVGRAKPAPHTRAVPPELEETRSLEAPDPDRTRAINIGELTTKLQITRTAGEEPETVNEPVRARATVAAPDTSGAEVTRSLSAPDPDRTRTITVASTEDETEATPDPDRTHTITIVSSDDRTSDVETPDPDTTQTIASEDVETTRSLSAPDPDQTQAIAVASDPEGTHIRKVAQLAAPLHLQRPAPPEELAAHPGRAPGQNTAPLSHTGDIGGDEMQVISLDPDRTQVIRPGTVEPPGERTEIVRLPAKGKATVPGPAEARTQPVRASVADAERPNFAEDPTGRIVPPDGADPSRDERGMTVMSMERPPEDEPGIPAQRRPS